MGLPRRRYALVGAARSGAVMRLRFGGLYHGNGQRVQYSEALHTEPADFCPVHALPMWWWPSGGEWACQVPTCEMKFPVAVEHTVSSLRVPARDEGLTVISRRPMRVLPGLYMSGNIRVWRRVWDWIRRHDRHA